jgi:hypothetical protein
MANDLSTTKPIEGKVASVLNERELAINIGLEHGVRVGMKFQVLAEKPTEIFDPATGEMLGMLDREKVRVKIFEVREKFSICKTYRKRYARGNALYDMLSVTSFMVEQSREIVETLKAEDSSLPPPLSEEESYVKKGDRVIQLLNDDE